MAKAPSVKWTREHFLIALNLYCKLPFGQLHRNNPVIVEAAAKMGRTASSLSMKLCNFASLDPVQQARGVRGLPGATRQEREMWDEFQAHTAALGPESEQLLHDLFTCDDSVEVDLLYHDVVRLVRTTEARPPIGPTESSTTVRVRRGQQFFRQVVLTAYGTKCCISGIAVPKLLVASHIKPWSDFPDERLYPRNGLCLSCLHDVAFDAGLITIDENFKVVLSRTLRSYLPDSALEQNFNSYEGRRMRLPEKIAEPNADFLQFHRDKVFLG